MVKYSLGKLIGSDVTTRSEPYRVPYNLDVSKEMLNFLKTVAFDISYGIILQLQTNKIQDSKNQIANRILFRFETLK